MKRKAQRLLNEARKLPSIIRDRRRRGRVFYDPKTKQLFQVKGVRRDYFICGAFCNYYGDARRQTNLIQLSRAYVLRCKEVICLDKMRQLKYDGIGWRVKAT